MGRGKYVSHIYYCKYTRDKYVSAKLVREMNRKICFMGFPLPPPENSIDIFILSIFYIAISFQRELSKYKWISYPPPLFLKHTLYILKHTLLYTITLYTIDYTLYSHYTLLLFPHLSIGRLGFLGPRASSKG